MTESFEASKRPLSPHLQIYRWPLTMSASIAHRITGVGLALGAVFITLWLGSLAYDEHLFNILDSWTHNIVIKLLLFIYSFALMLHMCGGIRHLIWDVKTDLMEKHIANKIALLTYITAIVTTLVAWVFGYIWR